MFRDWTLISLLKFSLKFTNHGSLSVKKKKKSKIKRFRGHAKLEKTIFAGDWGVFRVRVRAVKNGSITVFPCAHVHKDERVGERFSARAFFRRFAGEREAKRWRQREREREWDEEAPLPLLLLSVSFLR